MRVLIKPSGDNIHLCFDRNIWVDPNSDFSKSFNYIIDSTNKIELTRNKLNKVQFQIEALLIHYRNMNKLWFDGETRPDDCIGFCAEPKFDRIWEQVYGTYNHIN